MPKKKPAPRVGRGPTFITIAAVLLYTLAGCPDSGRDTPAGDLQSSQIPSVRNRQHFESILKTNDGLVVLKFKADWCSPCRQLTPILNAIARKRSERVKFYSVDIDRHRDLAQLMRVRGIPLVLMVRDGKVVARLTGLHPERVYQREIDAHL